MLRWGGYYHPHFLDDEAENQRLRVSPGLKSATRACALFYNQLINLSALGLSYRTWNLPSQCMDSLVVVLTLTLAFTLTLVLCLLKPTHSLLLRV